MAASKISTIAATKVHPRQKWLLLRRFLQTQLAFDSENGTLPVRQVSF